MTDRRLHGRATAAAVRRIAVRIRPGLPVAVVNVSEAGALVECTKPLSPGTRVDVQVTAESDRTTLSARVLRCTVAAIDPECGVTYRAALSFESHLPLDSAIGAIVAQGGYSLPGDCPALASTTVAEIPTLAVLAFAAPLEPAK